jgi:hypothetical protein
LVDKPFIAFEAENSMKHKKCNRCGEWKLCAEFHKRSDRPNGLQPKCKACQKAINYKWRAANPEQTRDLRRSSYSAIGHVTKRVYDSTPDARAKHRENARQYRARNPEKVRAHNAVRHAVKMGRLQRTGCAVCGAGNAHAHHHDYTKPLDVIWLCKTHHADEHRKARHA